MQIINIRKTSETIFNFIVKRWGWLQYARSMVPVYTYFHSESYILYKFFDAFFILSKHKATIKHDEERTRHFFLNQIVQYRYRRNPNTWREAKTYLDVSLKAHNRVNS